MAEQKRRPAYLGTIPVSQGGHVQVAVTTEGLVSLGSPDGREYLLEEGPALVLGTMLQLAVQVGQAARLRQIQALGTAGPPRA